MSQDPDLPFMINLTMGDRSGDGHCKVATLTILSNFNKKALEKAYRAGVKKTGVDFVNEVANDYEDSSVSVSVVESLAKHGFKIEEISEDEESDNDKYSLTTDGYALVWLFIAQVGNQNLKFEIVEDDRTNIHIGGYGLF